MINMLLFTILACITAALTFISFVLITIGGTVATIVFADVIVCIALMVLLMRRILKKRKKQKD